MFSYTAWSVSAPYFLAALAFGYALGSIPFGYLLARSAGLGDIRSIGSGNIGATNVLRTGRKALAAATLLADAGKGVAAVLIAAQWGPDTAGLAGLGAFLGHLFPVWLGFRGGKGVATFLGVVGATVWQVGAIFAWSGSPSPRSRAIHRSLPWPAPLSPRSRLWRWTAGLPSGCSRSSRCSSSSSMRAISAGWCAARNRGSSCDMAIRAAEAVA